MKVEAPGVLSLLGVAFIILKLCHVIAWSWWWVLLPFWGPALVLVAILILWGIILAAFAIAEKRAKKKFAVARLRRAGDGKR